MGTRAYPDQGLRLQRRLRLAWNIEDVRREVMQARIEDEPVSIYLAGDIILPDARPLLLSNDRAIEIYGGNRYTIRQSFAADCAVEVDAPVLLDGVTLDVDAAVTGALRISIGAAGALKMRDCTVDMVGSPGSPVFAGGATSASIERLSLVQTGDLFADDAQSYYDCRLAQITALKTGANVGLVPPGASGAGGTATGCIFEGCTGDININTTGAVRCLFVAPQGDGVASSIAGTGDANVFIAPAFFSAISISGNNVALAMTDPSSGQNVTVIGGPLALTSASVVLSVANPTLTTKGASVVDVTHGAGSSGSVQVGAGLQNGQQLTLTFSAAYAGTATYQNTAPAFGGAQLRLSASPFTPTQHDTISFVWRSSTSTWYETARSVNA